jgi:pyruvate formate lyase activating enzyme
MKEAMLYRVLDGGQVQCDLCAHRCKIKPDRSGICNVRLNRGGTLETLVYGKAIAAHVDPIEKKPLYHFLPGTTSFSIATVGCNFRCVFCQNADISQLSDSSHVVGQDLPPSRVVEAALNHGCDSISYTYTEPTVFFEYALDTSRLAREKGLKNVFVTNGYMTPEAIQEIHPYLDAANIDLKSFQDSFYRRYCGARLQPVLDSIQDMHRRGIWVELTTLIIPGHNDSPQELRDIAQFIAGLDADIPWHVSRFVGRYKMADTPPTPPETIHRAIEVGKDAGLRYIYAGNLPGDDAENTRCPSCGQVAVQRVGYSTRIRLDGNRCAGCGCELPLIR